MFTITPKYNGHIGHRYNSVITYPAAELPSQTIVEVGPGRGDFLFHLAQTNPEKAVYGVEIKSKRFHKLITRRDKRKLDNIIVVLADAAIALPELFDEASVDAIYINFPDPWPKKKHAKNRLLKASFLHICADVLRPGGTLFITTDVDWYAHDAFESCKKIDCLVSPTDSVSTESNDAYPTFFAEKWLKEGRTIYYQKYTKSP